MLYAGAILAATGGMVVPRFWIASWQRAALAALLLGVLVSLTLSLATSTAAGPVEKVYWIDDATFSSFAVDDRPTRIGSPSLET